MVSKICSYCNKLIKKVNVHNQKYHKECAKEYRIEYKKKYNALRKKRKFCKLCGEEIFNGFNSRRYHPECAKIKKNHYRKEWGRKNPEKSKQITNNYAKKNKEKIREKQEKLRREKGMINRKTYLRNKKKSDKEKKERKNEWTKNKWANDKEFRIISLLRHRFREAFRTYTKNGKMMNSKKYGLDYKAIIEYLKPFPKNISKYHIDHIRPLCSFEFIKEDGSTNLNEVKKAFAPENHQWLLAHENLVKWRKY